MIKICLHVTGDINLTGYATVCMTCSKRLIEHPLQKCSGCKLVFYCSKEHQKVHWPQHKHLCKAIQLMIKKTNNIGLFDDYVDEGFSMWTNFRHSLILISEGILKRKMTPNEKALFLQPFCCKVCHIHINNCMLTCTNCGLITYCSEDHKQKDEAHHSVLCDYYKFGLDFDVYSMEGFVIYFTIDDVEILQSNMQEFIENHINVETKPAGREKYGSGLLSYHLSIPLTIIFVLQKCGFPKTAVNKEQLTLHVIGSSRYENYSAWSWEYIFHCFKNIKLINLVLIGPDSLDHFLPPFLSCADCRNTRKINFSVESTLYHEYLTKKVEVPDLIVAFNCGFHAFHDMPQHDTWKKSMKSLCSIPNTIVAFTSYNEDESVKDLNTLKKYCENDNLHVLVHCEENPYRSLLPFQDWYNEGGNIFYSNCFINVIQN